MRIAAPKAVSTAALFAGPMLAGLLSGSATVEGVAAVVAEAMRGHPAIFEAARPAPLPQRLRLAPSERPDPAGMGRAAGRGGGDRPPLGAMRERA